LGGPGKRYQSAFGHHQKEQPGKRTARLPLGQPGCIVVFALRAGLPTERPQGGAERSKAGTQKQVVGGCPWDNPPGVRIYHPTGVYDNRSKNHLLPKLNHGDAMFCQEHRAAELPIVLRSHDLNNPIISLAIGKITRSICRTRNRITLASPNRPWGLNLGSQTILKILEFSYHFASEVGPELVGPSRFPAIRWPAAGVNLTKNGRDSPVE